MARRLKGKARPETKQERQARILAQAEADQYQPVVLAVFAGVFGLIVIYFYFATR